MASMRSSFLMLALQTYLLECKLLVSRMWQIDAPINSAHSLQSAMAAAAVGAMDESGGECKGWRMTACRNVATMRCRMLQYGKLWTAAHALYEIGFHNTSLDDIARRLNVTNPTIYCNVRNKEEILFECVRIGLEMLDEVSNGLMGHGGIAEGCIAPRRSEDRRLYRVRRLELDRPLISAERRPQCPRHRGPVHRPADERPGQNQNIRGGP